MRKYGSAEGLAVELQNRLKKRTERAREKGKLDSFITLRVRRRATMECGLLVIITLRLSDD